MTTKRTGLARRYVQRYIDLVSACGVPIKRGEWEDTPYIHFRISAQYEDGIVDSVRTKVEFTSDEIPCIEAAAATCMALLRNNFELCGKPEEMLKIYRAEQAAHIRALNELHNGTLPEVTEP